MDKRFSNSPVKVAQSCASRAFPDKLASCLYVHTKQITQRFSYALPKGWRMRTELVVNGKAPEVDCAVFELNSADLPKLRVLQPVRSLCASSKLGLQEITLSQLHESLTNLGLQKGREGLADDFDKLRGSLWQASTGKKECTFSDLEVIDPELYEKLKVYEFAPWSTYVVLPFRAFNSGRAMNGELRIFFDGAEGEMNNLIALSLLVELQLLHRSEYRDYCVDYDLESLCTLVDDVNTTLRMWSDLLGLSTE